MRCVFRVSYRLIGFILLSAFCGTIHSAGAQDTAVPQRVNRLASAAAMQDAVSRPQPAAAQLAPSSEGGNAAISNSSPLLLGPGDELEVTVYGAPDLSGRTRISETGNISMPLIGYVRVAGLSTSEAEAAIEAQLRQNNIVNDPQVSIYAKDFTNSGISVAGEVAKPGFYSALGPHRLFDVLQLAGGPTDKASTMVTISHRGQQDTTTVTISRNPTEMAAGNLELKPGDTVVVPRAGIVYVLGEINRPGGYVLNSTGGITVMQVVAAAGGPTHLASYGKTILLHRTPTGFDQQKIDLKKLLHGKRQDVAVKNDDILFVPTSGMKTALNASALVGMAGAAALYRIPF